jgi:WhiB family redox-sensing transcriptional regulator
VEALTAAAGRTDTALQELRGDVLTTVTELRERVLTTTAEATAAGSSAAERLRALTEASTGLRRDLDELGAGMVAATSELVAELRARSTRETDQLRTSLEAVRTGFDTRAEELAATLARGLLDIAEEVDVATTTTRDAAQRVSLLSEVTEAHRAGVEGLLQEVRADVLEAGQGLRQDLLDRTTTLLGELGARLADVEERLSGVDGTVAGSTVAAERVAAGLDALTDTAQRLDEVVGGFRAEWPTRTYEVVEGARAVAEGVVLDVRAEVGARLDDVRTVLDRVVGTVEQARTGLHDGTDRLASAGAVLVAYLEHRDRLLEAERDRVLHEVLDAFAAGLSARERSALAGRVTDAVARRRDARDAERYRAALGEPVSPTADLPEDVRALGERAPDQGAPDRGAPEDGPQQDAAPEPAPAPAAPSRPAPDVAASERVPRRRRPAGPPPAPGPQAARWSCPARAAPHSPRRGAPPARWRRPAVGAWAPCPRRRASTSPSTPPRATPTAAEGAGEASSISLRNDVTALRHRYHARSACGLPPPSLDARAGHACNSTCVVPPAQPAEGRPVRKAPGRRPPSCHRSGLRRQMTSEPIHLAALGDDETGVLGWQEQALCAQTDPEAFFPEKGGSTREAKRICIGCEVKGECLEYALGQDERFGIWGGLSERERRRLKRAAG